MNFPALRVIFEKLHLHSRLFLGYLLRRAISFVPKCLFQKACHAAIDNE
jgi:hypothetical protein